MEYMPSSVSEPVLAKSSLPFHMCTPCLCRILSGLSPLPFLCCWLSLNNRKGTSGKILLMLFFLRCSFPLSFWMYFNVPLLFCLSCDKWINLPFLPHPSVLSSVLFCFVLFTFFLNLKFPVQSHYSFTPWFILVLILTSLFSSSALAQCVLEEMAGREAELGGLREKAHHLWEGQAAGKGFVHRVSQLSAQYLALSNLTKVMLPPSYNPVTPFSMPFLCIPL